MSKKTLLLTVGLVISAAFFVKIQSTYAGGGAFVVSLAPDSPVAQGVTISSQTFTDTVFTKIRFSNEIMPADADHEVYLYKFRLNAFKNNSGQSIPATPQDLSGIDVYDGGTKIAGVIPSQDGSAQFSFWPNQIRLPSGSSKTLTVKGRVPFNTSAQSLHIDLVVVETSGGVNINRSLDYDDLSTLAIGGATGAPMTINKSSIPDLRILSPNGGETWADSETKNITWQGGPQDLKNDIRLIKASELPTSDPAAFYGYYSLKANSQLVGSNNSFTWTVGDIGGYVLPVGSYIIRIIASDGLYDDSDKAFNIVSSSPVTPEIIGISPTEAKQGQFVTIEINGKNFTGQINLSGCGLNPVSDRGFQLVSCSVVSDNMIRATYSISSTAIIGSRSISLATSNSLSNSKLFNITSSSLTGAVNTNFSQIGYTTNYSINTDNGVIILFIAANASIADLNGNQLDFDDLKSGMSVKVFGSKNNYYTDANVWDINSVQILSSTAILPLPYPNGTLVKISSSDKIHLIENNQKRWITSVEAFLAYGLKPNSEITISQVDLDKYTTGPDITTATPNLSDGALIRAKGDVDVWIVKYVGAKKFKRLILSPSVFNSYKHLKWKDIKDVERSVVDSFITSDLVRAANDARVFKLSPSGDTGQRAWVKTAGAFNQRRFDWDAIYEINSVDRDSYLDGQVLE